MFYEKSNEVEFHRTQPLDKNLGFFLTERVKGFEPFSKRSKKAATFLLQQSPKPCQLAFSAMGWVGVHGGYADHARVLQKSEHRSRMAVVLQTPPRRDRKSFPLAATSPAHPKKWASRGADRGKIAGVVHSFLHKGRERRRSTTV